MHPLRNCLMTINVCYKTFLNTFVSLFLLPHVSPSLIHMPVKVLFAISHSCQILPGTHVDFSSDPELPHMFKFDSKYVKSRVIFVSVASYPNIPLQAFHLNDCSCWVTLWKGQNSYLYLQNNQFTQLQCHLLSDHQDVLNTYVDSIRLKHFPAR